MSLEHRVMPRTFVFLQLFSFAVPSTKRLYSKLILTQAYANLTMINQFRIITIQDLTQIIFCNINCKSRLYFLDFLAP